MVHKAAQVEPGCAVVSKSQETELEAEPRQEVLGGKHREPGRQRLRGSTEAIRGLKEVGKRTKHGGG